MELATCKVDRIYSTAITRDSRRPRRRKTLPGVDIDPGALRRARQERRLSLSQLAGSQLSRQAVWLYENGKAKPSMRSLRVMASRLNMPISRFLPPGGEHSLLEQWCGDLDELLESRRYAALVAATREALRANLPREAVAIAEYHLGLALQHLMRCDEALPHLHSAYEFWCSTDPWKAAEAQDWIAQSLYSKQDPTAFRMAEDALHRYRALEPRDPRVEATMLEHLGTQSLKREPNAPEKATRYYQEALRTAGSSQRLDQLARIYHGLACAALLQGDARRAIETMDKAVHLYGVATDFGEFLVGLPQAENDLAEMVAQHGQLERAEVLYRSALRRLSVARIETHRSTILKNLAALHRRRGRLRDAIALTERAVLQATKLNEPITLASAYRQLGELWNELRRDDLVDAYFARALDILSQTGFVELHAASLAAHEEIRSNRGVRVPIITRPA